MPLSAYLNRRSAILFALAVMTVPGLVQARVEITGLSGELRDNALALVELAAEPCDAPEWRVRRLHAEADRQLRDALEAYGHYNAVIEESLELQGDCWLASFAVEPGEPVRLRNISVDIDTGGQADEAWQKLRDSNPMKTGEPFRHSQYERYKQRLTDLANRRGYFEGEFLSKRVDVYPLENAADVSLSFRTGPRYRYGEISIDQGVLDESLVRRFVKLEPGAPYDAREIGELYEDLVITGYFDNVEIDSLPRPAPDLDVPVILRLGPGKQRTYSAGVGYGTDSGIKLRGGYINRRRNVQGHQLEFNTELSQVTSDIGVTYRLPLRDPRVEWLSFDLGYRYEDTDTSRSEQTKFGIKRFKRRSGSWLETWLFDLAYEDYTVGLDSGTTFLPIPGISWSQVVTSGPPRPDRGHRVNLQFTGTTEYLGSSTEYLQLDLVGKLIWPLWSGARVLMRLDSGFTLKDTLRDLPASVRYFAGGDTSVRGYDYKSLGPVDASGDVVGGSHLLVGSIEIDQHLFGKWSIAAFVDSGNAYEQFDEMDLKTSVGGGVRWYSPLGPIRFDVGVPLDNDAPDNYRIHITLGPDL